MFRSPPTTSTDASKWLTSGAHIETVPRKVSRAVRAGVTKVTSKVTASKVAMVGYGGVMGAGRAVALAPHVTAWVAAATAWL